MGRWRVWFGSAVIVVAGSLAWAGVASANPIFLPTITKRLQQEPAIHAADQRITPPTPPCPESGYLPSPFSNCGLPETPATSLPYMGNMAYWGGHVQTTPREYLVFWGWTPAGFGQSSCASESFTEGSIAATLPCDPDGAGKYMADFVQQMGGTSWANVSTQYYQTDSSGNPQYATNPSDVLAGIWVDNGDGASNLPSTTASAPAGSANTYYDLAQEAVLAAQHFGVSGAALANANFIIIQPPKYSDPNALSSGYCAFHDYTLPQAPGNSYYQGISTALSYTNMPYSLAINSGGVNVCGENAVNSGPSGKLDGFSIVLGHEIEETITDPGAEDVVSSGPSGSQTYYGGWYDPFDANENGDKCAWVGENLVTAQGPPEPIYGALGNIQGNAGKTFAVQSLWSNAANQGTGYCAGVPSSDSPLPSAPYGSSTSPAANGGSSPTSTAPGSPTGGAGSAQSGAGPTPATSKQHRAKRARRARRHRARRARCAATRRRRHGARRRRARCGRARRSRSAPRLLI